MTRSKVIPALVMLISVTGMGAKEWRAMVGGESPDGSGQALAFLPNEFWIHTSDSIRWTFSGDEIHTVTFLKNGQLRPPNYSSTFGVEVGCGSPVATADGSSYDGRLASTPGTSRGRRIRRRVRGSIP
jgi:plastocyanin